MNTIPSERRMTLRVSADGMALITGHGIGRCRVAKDPLPADVKVVAVAEAQDGFVLTLESLHFPVTIGYEPYPEIAPLIANVRTLAR